MLVISFTVTKPQAVIRPFNTRANLLLISAEILVTKPQAVIRPLNARRVLGRFGGSGTAVTKPQAVIRPFNAI